MRREEKWFTIHRIVVPIITMILASVQPWLDCNLSVIGNAYGKRMEFIVWGSYTVCFFWNYLKKLYQKVQYQSVIALRLLMVACAIFITAVVLPYDVEQYPVCSVLHVGFAFVSPCILAISIACFTWYVYHMDGSWFKEAPILLLVLVVGGIIILYNTVVITSFLEIYVVLAVVLYLYYLEIKMEKYYETSIEKENASV